MISLLRHGEAEDGAGADAERRLTARGERQAGAAGRALAGMGMRFEACLTSPKVRAAQTARLVGAELGIEPETAAALTGPFDALELAAGRGDVLLVGHEPHLSNEIARLTGAKLKLRKGGLAIVDGSTLQALLRPNDLGRIGSRG